jgi:glycosyltransferase involved in cell wall biosynthesis
MGKLALTFICKNEEHCILTMLNSVKDITDLICGVDTGSNDQTVQIIKQFGVDNNIPTYVFERPFDNFENSRNHGMQKLREVIKELGWDATKTHSFFVDCDETMVIDPKFDKNQFVNDLYMINTMIGSMKYTRNTFARVSMPFRFSGFVHEYIVCDQPNITSGLAENIYVDVKMIGQSWKGDISQKYKSHATILENYLDTVQRDPRSLFYTAQSYHDSASIPDNRAENEERLRRSIKYYRERVSRNDGYAEERYYSQYRIGSIMRMLECPWIDTQQELLKAYAMDPLRGESIKLIIDYYLSVGEWSLAYLYSKFCKVNFHAKNPYPTRLLFVDQSLYSWKFLESHAAAAFYCGKKDESRAVYEELMDILRKSPEMFNESDVNKINSNAQFFK